ncbi:hypothetical protein SAMN05216226_104233 [Halovenus aranensis]|uniref:Uncharacterized protein n=1 Tax=Halovenus aranensis TaxID=890420 RepID=A0A1G8UFS5_9EURY|nr:hypothetical protein [Halovenus aranensis]SDJ52571.1 hypothetical protein SAMN05216226_104233 [Halovenus aranensis]
MSEFELDLETFVIFPIFALGTSVSLGLIEAASIPVVDLGETLLSTGNIDWTIGRVMSVLALAAVVINRDEPLDFDAWGIIEAWTVYVTIGLIVAPPFFPALESTLASTPAALAAFIVQGIGFSLVTYIN